MRYDHSTFSELDTPEARCPHCRGRGFSLYERDNPMAAEPCGCDEPEWIFPDNDEDEEC